MDCESQVGTWNFLEKFTDQANQHKQDIKACDVTNKHDHHSV